MNRKKDWLTKNHVVFHSKVGLMTGYMNIMTNRARMHLHAGSDAGDFYDTILMPAITAFNAAFDPWENEASRSQQVNTAFFEAEAALKPLYREWYAMLKLNRNVTNVDLEAMGFPPRPDGEIHESEIPTDVPVLDIVHTSEGVVKLKFKNSEGKRGKPDGVHGIEIRWNTVAEMPVSVEELIHSDFATKSTFYISFDYSKKGEMLCIAIRYENMIGQKGPWSGIYSTIIS